jgi:hypothetical protein
MVKMLITITLFLICLKLSAPPSGVIAIIDSEPIRPYEAILRACIEVESSGDRFAYNSIERATGILQITPVRLLDFNIQSGKHYTQKDCFDIEVSKEIFFWYVSKCDYRDIKSMAVAWNGISKENKYYAKILKAL